LDKTTKRNLVKALQATRQVLPGQNNWLLFAAMVEAGLCFMGEWWDPMRVDYAIQQHKEWFVGDGTYGDGPHFHWDYYNSLVIQPMLLQVVETVQTKSPTWSSLRPVVLESAALCGDSGADDQPGGYVSCDWAITDVPVWSISPVERHQPAEAVACGGNAPAGAVRPDGGDAADDREAGDLRCQGLADDWVRGPSAGVGGDVYFDGKLLSVCGGVAAAGAAGERRLLGGCGEALDGGEGLGRGRHEGGSCVLGIATDLP
jgi:hypothetical protein